MNLLNLIIFLKDGTQHKIRISISRLIACGTNENNFFIEIHKEGRIEAPLDSIDGFKIEALNPPRTYLLNEDAQIYLTTAVGILSKHST